MPDRVTGSIYTFKGADREKVVAALKPLGQWNAYEIQVQGQNIKVFLNGVLVNDFTSTDAIATSRRASSASRTTAAASPSGTATSASRGARSAAAGRGRAGGGAGGERRRDARGRSGRHDVAGRVRPERHPRLHRQPERDGDQHGGAATLTVADASATQTGKLVNGTHALAQPLQVRSGTAAFAPRERRPGRLLARDRTGQRRAGAGRVQAVDRRARPAPDRPLQQDADVHAVEHDAVS